MNAWYRALTREEAMKAAVNQVELLESTIYVLRRGDEYMTSLNECHGWDVAEMIGPGNIHHYKFLLAER